MLIDENLESPCPGCGCTLFAEEETYDVGGCDDEPNGYVYACLRCGYETWHAYWQEDDA